MVATAVLLGCAACGGQPAATAPRHGIPEKELSAPSSRTKLFSSLEELAEDSPLIVTGAISNTRVDNDVDGQSHVTLHDVDVINVLKGDVRTGDCIVLRQSGSDDPSILEDGETAMLFLLPSGLPGDLGEQYFPKGVYAGIYMLSDASQRSLLRQSATNGDESADDVDFSRLITGTGDSLPDNVSLADIKAIVGES